MKTLIAAAAFLALAPALAASTGSSFASDDQVSIAVTVTPGAVGAGTDAAVSVKLDPKPGIKMNKFPKIRLQIPAVAGLVGAAEQSLGNTAPPPVDKLDENYFHGGVDPLSVTLHLDGGAAKGRHDIHAKLSYYYCVAASGYCAPAKTDVTIPVTVR